MIIQILDKRLERFIESLEKSTVAKLLRIIDLLEIFGYQLGMPHSKKISNKMFELRIRGSQEARIFYTFHKSEIILLHGFIKKTRTIPNKEIQIALRKIKQFDGV